MHSNVRAIMLPFFESEKMVVLLEECFRRINLVYSIARKWDPPAYNNWFEIGMVRLQTKSKKLVHQVVSTSASIAITWSCRPSIVVG